MLSVSRKIHLLILSSVAATFSAGAWAQDAASRPTPVTAAPAATPASVPVVDTFRSDPKFLEAMKHAKAQEHDRDLANAADTYKKANKIAGGRCIECLEAMYKTQMAYHEFKDALQSATSLQAVAILPATKSFAALMRAEAILGQAGEKAKPAQLEAADAALKDAIAAYPKGGAARFLDGKVLAKMGKMDEAKDQFLECVKCASPTDPSRLRAEHFAENPALALNKMAPAFEVNALDGSKFNLDAMGGRVVLIDFWATWCGPCNEELPEMKKIAKEFAGQPLVILSVSWDSDAEAWKKFIEKNEMTWAQYRDADHKLTRNFGIESIPHYFTIDSDGVLTSEMVGSGSNVEGRLKKMLAKARESQHVMETSAKAGN